MYLQLFDPKTVTTVEGEVTALTRTQHKMIGVTGVHATVKTATGELDVHLGPSWFVDNQELKLEAGDKVKVTGSKVTVDGKQALIATEVARGELTLQLRDADGLPRWVAWRHRSS